MFCWKNLAGVRSREHVVAAWYLESRGIRKKRIELGLYGPDFCLIEPRPLVLDSLLAGKVCENCNSGWMSQLEGAARPILIPLISGAQHPRNLDSAEKEILAKWAFKTAFALDAATMGPRRVAAWHPRNLAPPSGRIPTRGVVLAAISPFEVDVELMEVNHWQGKRENSKSGKLFATDSKRSYKVAIQFGRLVLLVAYWPNDRSLFVFDENLHEIVWPLSGREAFAGVRPPIQIENAQHFLYYFAAALGVAESRFDPRG